MWYEGLGNPAWVGIIISLIWNFLNTSLTLWRNGVHIKFSTSYYEFDGNISEDNEHGFSSLANIRPTWDIVNLSAFTIFIDEIGFCSHKFPWITRPDKSFHVSAFLIKKTVTKSGHSYGGMIELPIKLESRESITLGTSMGEGFGRLKYKYMFIKTSCGLFYAKKVHPYVRKRIYRQSKS